MSLYDAILSNLQQEASLSDEESRALAREISRLIESQARLKSLPDTFVEREIGDLAPVIQVMLAHDHSSIQNAAQYVVQVLTEDPRATIPVGYRAKQYCPYPGLSAFTESNSQYFYGRDEQIESFLALIDQCVAKFKVQASW